MAYRIAVATSDGKVVNQHFGQADRFHIFGLDGSGSFAYVRTQTVKASCGGASHEVNAFAATADALKDAQAILVSRIGQAASTFLEKEGFVVYEAPHPVEPLLQKIADERLYEVDAWHAPTKN